MKLDTIDGTRTAMTRAHEEAVRRGHPNRTKYAAAGGLFGAVLGSFKGPFAAGIAALVGAIVGAMFGDDRDRQRASATEGALRVRR